MTNETNTMQSYVKTKKNTKSLKWRRATVGKPTTKRQTQLDRIERKLDELLLKWNAPVFWPNPPRREEEKSFPRDWFGNPVPYANGGAR